MGGDMSLYAYISNTVGWVGGMGVEVHMGWAPTGWHRQVVKCHYIPIYALLILGVEVCRGGPPVSMTAVLALPEVR